MGEVLASEGFEVAFAKHGREALELLEIGPLPDLILLDWIMPEMGGEELLGALDGSQLWQSIPVIVLTALSRLSTPGRRVVRKPIDLEELVWTVAEMCPPGFPNDEEAPTDRTTAPPLARDPEQTAREICVRCGKRAATRCQGCGEAYCENCFDGIASPGARCEKCRAK